MAFDIDGVVADTMSLFIDIARTEYHVNSIQYQDITSYSLMECLNMDPEVMSAISQRLIDGNYSLPLRPYDLASQVIEKMGRHHKPVLFVTARPYPGPMEDWFKEVLALDESLFEIISTGSFEAKTDVLLDRQITCFVEDRYETCVLLDQAGIRPIVFRQPWNRENRTFTEVNSWQDIERLIAF